MAIDAREKVLLDLLEKGYVPGINGEGSATLTVKGFVGANIVAARVALRELPRPLSEQDIVEIIEFLQTAENSLTYLTDPEDNND
jgi:hypothetical protein